jgi:hypothetical protein
LTIILYRHHTTSNFFEPFFYQKNIFLLELKKMRNFVAGFLVVFGRFFGAIIFIFNLFGAYEKNDFVLEFGFF